MAICRLWMVTPRVARRASLLAAARRLKSAFTFARPRTRARRAAVPASHQMTDLPLDLRASRCVVGLPHRIGLAFASAGDLLLVRAEADRLPGRPVVHRSNSGHDWHAPPKRATCPPLTSRSHAVRAAGAHDRAELHVDPEVVFGEPSCGRDRRLDLAQDVRADVLERVQDAPGAVRGVAVDRQRLGCRSRRLPARARRQDRRLLRARQRAAPATSWPSPALPAAVTVVAVINSLSGSNATCLL